MSTLQAVLDDAVRAGDVPFAVAMVGDKNGIKWSGAAGERAPGQVAGADTVFRIFSMTKAVGSTAAMLLIDRGKLDAETPVEDILPEFAKIQVLERFDGDKPVLRAPKRKATVRQLGIAIDIVIVLIDRPEFISDTGVSPEVDDPPVDGLPARAIARDIEHGTLHSCNSAVILAGNDPFC